MACTGFICHIDSRLASKELGKEDGFRDSHQDDDVQDAIGFRCHSRQDEIGQEQVEFSDSPHPVKNERTPCYERTLYCEQFGSGLGRSWIDSSLFKLSVTWRNSWTIGRKHFGLSSICFVFITYVCLLQLLARGAESIEWLAVAKRRDDGWNRTSNCRTEGILNHQRRLCTRNLDMMPAIAQASRMTAQVCQELFFDSRWNCSSVLLAPKFLPDLTGGSREQAVVHALASASLTQFIARHCSSGNAIKCSCGRLPTDPVAPGADFKWGGCSDDVKFALTFAQQFTHAAYKKTNKTKRALMNIHNDQVGRKVMSESLTTACKCHGVSGSCSIRTCWKTLADLRTVGATVLQNYSLAVEVAYKKLGRQHHDNGEGGVKVKEKSFVPMLASKQNVSSEELIFYTMSPDYCLPEADLGSVGTKGRECQKDQTSSAGCRSMCCGRGFTTEMVDVQYRCECKYYWCCYVKCKTCTKTVEISRCR